MSDYCVEVKQYRHWCYGDECEKERIRKLTDPIRRYSAWCYGGYTSRLVVGFCEIASCRDNGGTPLMGVILQREFEMQGRYPLKLIEDSEKNCNFTFWNSHELVRLRMGNSHMQKSNATRSEWYHTDEMLTACDNHIIVGFSLKTSGYQAFANSPHIESAQEKTFNIMQHVRAGVSIADLSKALGVTHDTKKMLPKEYMSRGKYVTLHNHFLNKAICLMKIFYKCTNTTQSDNWRASVMQIARYGDDITLGA